ncbi:hypothetical protein B0T14DRAFT_604344 [Immersiella caudata]|uniref:Heterokaryon incompatibility domain-containing protein n=1 Tax=Immersiella caudata TaxID=314043 RepID=A0AA39WSQ1_9PEZI|nr:hypothetical protein B0T14DRAFT_604344 [Immersiella caudata]
MRDAIVPRQLWVDALCINQLDPEEKAVQVALMGRICSTASHTIIHLPFVIPEVERLMTTALNLGVGCPPLPSAPLRSLLAARRGIGTTDPRDILYSNFGIVSDLGDISKYVKVDYYRSIEDLFCDTARYILGTAGLNMLIFHALGGVKEEKVNGQVPNLPSWPPDFTRKAGTNPLNNQKPRQMAFVSGSAMRDPIGFGAFSGNLLIQDGIDLKKISHGHDKRLRVINLQVKGVCSSPHHG